MTTTNTHAFNLDLNLLVEEAFERCGAELRTGYDLRTATRSLNLLTIEWANRGINLWTVEQGQLVLEYALLTMLHLLTVEEARFRLYLTGVYRPFRSIVLGDEGASPEAREKCVLCTWFLFEWQVEKLEILDRKVSCP